MNTQCEYCGDIFKASSAGRTARFCSNACRVANHRREKRYKETIQGCNDTPDLRGQLVLELFPGAGLFGRAFSALGATVVNAGDIMQGYDIHEFKAIPGKFDIVIGGPPCQVFSSAARNGTNATNLIPEFVRIVEEARPRAAIMENVREAKHAAPNWEHVYLRDFDCGGFTNRVRGFWFDGIPAPAPAAKRPGVAAWTVLASHWNNRGTKRKSSYAKLSAHEAGRLQGFPDLPERIMKHQPGWKRANGQYMGVTSKSRDVIATHMLGNGVPLAMGLYIARYVAAAISGQSTAGMGLPLFDHQAS